MTRLAALVLLWVCSFAGVYPVTWTWPTTNVDGSALTDLDHGRMVLYRCRADSIVRRLPPLKPLWIAKVDSIVLPNIPSTGSEGDSAAADLDMLDGHVYRAALQAVDHSGNLSPIFSLTFAMPAQADPPPPPPADTSGTGITGNYYSGQSRNLWIGARRDTTIDFAWGSGTAMPGLPVDYWSAEWYGKLVVPTTGVYTLYVEAQSGAQLAIAGTMWIDHLGDFPLTEWSATRTLQAGEHVLDLVYTARAGNAQTKLSWSSAGIPKQVIQRGALR